MNWIDAPHRLERSSEVTTVFQAFQKNSYHNSWPIILKKINGLATFCKVELFVFKFEKHRLKMSFAFTQDWLLIRRISLTGILLLVFLFVLIWKSFSSSIVSLYQEFLDALLTSLSTNIGKEFFEPRILKFLFCSQNQHSIRKLIPWLAFNCT